MERTLISSSQPNEFGVLENAMFYTDKPSECTQEPHQTKGSSKNGVGAYTEMGAYLGLLLEIPKWTRILMLVHGTCHPHKQTVPLFGSP